ncbi:MAG: 1-deoxy-D-xylulose-5-phosphate reductoisomerase [Steroidobacteraceae bacterium]
MIGVAVLGSTGSIGDSTLDVCARHPDQFRVVGLGARRNVAKLLEQSERFRPDVVALADTDAAAEFARLARQRGLRLDVLAGEQGLVELACMSAADFVMAAIVGAAGLQSSLAAARAGKRLMLANKEALVMSGPLLIDAARRAGATLLPIDSEHNAVFQCLPADFRAGEAPVGVRRILLTASGGPFLDWDLTRLRDATPDQACAHPNWVMGRKISVDSATLMNKGLELIEASLLFGLPPDRIDIVVHRQSIVHSMVEYVDGSVLAQLGSPDMRTPIAHALAWPRRVASGVQFLDLVKVGGLDFRAPDPGRFHCLSLAQQAAGEGGLAPALLNAANEVAVAAFLEGRVNFLDIATVIDSVMQQQSRRLAATSALNLEDVLAADAAARQAARAAVESLGASQG